MPRVIHAMLDIGLSSAECVGSQLRKYKVFQSSSYITRSMQRKAFTALQEMLRDKFTFDPKSQRIISIEKRDAWKFP